MTAPEIRVSAGELEALVARIFVRLGAPDHIAADIAKHLVQANLAGHDSHGVIRVPEYAQEIRDGSLLPAAEPRVVRGGDTFALCSGEWGFGQVGAAFATNQACDRAQAIGVGVAGLLRCNHLGRLGDYMERACGRGLVALMWVGGFGLTTFKVVPHGGREGIYGGNPFAAGFPTGAGDVIVDLATSAVAAGKVLVARDAGQKIPEGWIVDAQGNPSSDPEDILTGGALLPFGEHKGSALAMLAELLGQIITGSGELTTEGRGGPTYAPSGMLVIALRLDLFRPGNAVKDDGAALLERLRSVPPAPGFDRVMAPGDPSVEVRRRRTVEGIPLPEATWRKILQDARSVGVSDAEIEVQTF